MMLIFLLPLLMLLMLLLRSILKHRPGHNTSNASQKAMVDLMPAIRAGGTAHGGAHEAAISFIRWHAWLVDVGVDRLLLLLVEGSGGWVGVCGWSAGIRAVGWVLLSLSLTLHTG